MFVSFDPLLFLAWLMVSSLLPGAILSFSIFRKDDFLFIEKLFIGFALGIILLPLIPFIAYFILGIKFSYTLVIFSVAMLYAIAIGFFVKNKSYENLSFSPPQFASSLVSKESLLSIGLFVIILLSYMIRLSSYSPVFQELDPYYYTYTAQQLLVFGENPFDDQTAWYPEVSTNHRIIPAISYLESIWYSLYTGGGEYNNMLLAVIASMYPPIAAALFVFFVYLFVSASSRREGGLVAAGLAAFAPVLLYKLAAGEQEVQPYAFFALFFFYAMYALSMKRKDLRFSVLAGIGFAAVALGSSSQLLALASMLLFIFAYAMLLFIRDSDAKELRYLVISTGIVFLIGPLLGSAVLKDVFSVGHPSLSIIAPFLIAIAFAAGLYFIKQQISDRTSSVLVLVAVLIAGAMLYAATPLGDYIQNVGKSGFEIAKFNRPLDRTIAEQGVAASEFGNQLGFMAETPAGISSSLLWATDSQALNDAVSAVFTVLFAIFSAIVNAVVGLSVSFLNLVLDSDVVFTSKASSFLLFWIFLFWVAIVYSLFLFFKKEDNLCVLFLAVIMPPLIVGIIKAKYTIYSAAMLAVAIGFLLGPTAHAISSIVRPDKLLKEIICDFLLFLGLTLIILQFVHSGFASSLLWGSTQTLYQNDPIALQAKFQDFCVQSGDSDVCSAAADPLGYASLGTNYQYSDKLCALSIYSNYSYILASGSAPGWEVQTAFFRCQRLASYWVDSMEWIKDNSREDARVISWWDYGHWINFFGQRDTVLRNEHSSHGMIGATAHAYLDGSPEDLKNYMLAHGSTYALFDMELVAGGGALGGKYGALNYLSCAWDNQTDVSHAPGESECESNHLWETIFISSQPCTISSLTNKTGFTAYKMYAGSQYLPYYPSFCVNPTDANAIASCRNFIQAVPVYCVGEAMLADGQYIYATYSLEEKYPNGDLKLNKANLQLAYQQPTSHIGDSTSVTLFYTEDPIWLENGEIKSGYEDRKGKFYDSNLYRGLFLNSIPGFKLVYSSPGGAVKIYEIEE